MKFRSLTIGLAGVALIGGTTWTYAEEEKDRTKRELPLITALRSTSLLSTSEVAELLRAGITRSDLRQRVSSIPLVRIGPGYVLYFLKDGRLRLPLSHGPNEQVVEWKLTNSAGTIIAEQTGTGQPATRPELKSEGGDKPKPESEGRSR